MAAARISQKRIRATVEPTTVGDEPKTAIFDKCTTVQSNPHPIHKVATNNTGGKSMFERSVKEEDSESGGFTNECSDDRDFHVDITSKDDETAICDGDKNRGCDDLFFQSEVCAPSSGSPACSSDNINCVTTGTAGNNSALLDREPEWCIYPEGNYSFQSKAHLAGKWGSRPLHEHHRKRLQAFEKDGTRRSVAALFLVHRMQFPHVLLLLNQRNQQQTHQQQKTPSSNFSYPSPMCLMSFKYKLWQKPRQVLASKLARILCGTDAAQYTHSNLSWVSTHRLADGATFEIGDYLGEWWRNEVDENFSVLLQPHITRPKEKMRIYQVQLQRRCCFYLPPGISLSALPLFNIPAARVGWALSGIAHYVARFHLRIMWPTVDRYTDTMVGQNAPIESCATTNAAVSFEKSAPKSYVAGAGAKGGEQTNAVEGKEYLASKDASPAMAEEQVIVGGHAAGAPSMDLCASADDIFVGSSNFAVAEVDKETAPCAQFEGLPPELQVLAQQE